MKQSEVEIQSNRRAFLKKALAAGTGMVGPVTYARRGKKVLTSSDLTKVNQKLS